VPYRQYCFADFTLDLEEGFLRRGVEEVKLRPKAFELLAYLVERHGRLVTKTALIEAVWPDVAITDNSLVQCLLEIRRALADDSHQVIRTVARRGYVFAAPVTTPVTEFPPQQAAHPEGGPCPATPSSVARKPLNSKIRRGAFVLLAMAAGGLLLLWLTRRGNHELSYAQITNFTDSAVAPALSPDGRMVAFYRSDEWFGTTDQIYVKLLPNGEEVQLTHDPRYKYSVAFSPDGSQIAYTAVVESGPWKWKTFTVSPLGGEPSLLLSNAAGLTWLDERRLLFSEVRTGDHMGIVTATENRSEYRQVYFPQHERGMAHFSYASPNRKWTLVIEMDPVWQPCRVIPLDGSSAGWQVGPQGKCTSAAWSPDGKWMYFGAEVGGNHHLWRQRFPNGEPEQITFGPTEEDGVAVAPDGRSLITSIGMPESAVWIHDTRGERPLTSEGHVTSRLGWWTSSLTFSSDGKSLFYLLRRESREAASELWRTDLESEKSEAALRGVSMTEYDVSSDGKEVVFSTQPSGKASQLWLAPLDGRSPPKLIASSGETSPHFGPDGQVLFQFTDGKANYLAQVRKDGSGRSKVASYAVSWVGNMSSDRRLIMVVAPILGGSQEASMAVPIGGGPPRRICVGVCPAAWAPNGKFLFVGVVSRSRTNPGKTLAIPVPPGEALPRLPASGVSGPDDAGSIPGARLIDGWAVLPGPDPSVFAYTKTTAHRNLFRIPLRDQ
jgi:DNA-binding winged helix-turn-helix (wHTH) protein/Tol biopolymer transport system component